MKFPLTKKIKEHLPSCEMLRYTNPGTEAPFFCLGLEYDNTGKYKIPNLEGHYHGGYNQFLIGVNPKVSEAGDIHQPTPLAESKGLEPYQMENTIVLPYNELEGCEVILRKHQN